MNAEFRYAGVDDVEVILDFMREYYEFDHLAFDEQVAKTSLQQILGDNSFGRAWVIHVDGSPIGYVVLTLGFSLVFRGRDAFIDEFYILKDQRGHGIGTRCLEVVEEACRSLGVQALHLEVGRNNPTAQSIPQVRI